MLLTADAESDVLATLDLGRSTCSRSPTTAAPTRASPALLERLRPRLAAIEVGAHNTYGHPAPATLRGAAGGPARVYRTDDDGTVRVEERGDGRWWRRGMAQRAGRRRAVPPARAI